MKKSRLTALIAFAIVFVLYAWYVIHDHQVKMDNVLAQAAYDYGQHIGQIQGSCQVIVGASDSDPAGAINQSDELKATISRCKDFLLLHAPGTPDTIALP